MIRQNLRVTALFVVLAFAFSPAGLADDAVVMTRLKDLENQMMEMQKTINWQRDKINMLENKQPEVRIVPSEQGADYFQKNLETYIGDSHKWLKDLKFFGDMRLRYEAVSERPSSASEDRNRFRYRLRFGFEKKFHPDMKVGFRIVSAPGESVSPTRTSTNTTFDTQFAYKDIAIDRAYATYTPGWASWGPVKSVEVTGGKFANPFEEGSTYIMWDSDVTPEGLYEKVNLELLKNDAMTLNSTALFGQLVLEEGGGFDHDDAEVYAYQFGLQPEINNVFGNQPLKTAHYFSFYNFNDFNLPGNFGSASGNFTGTGNQSTRLATGFNVIDIYNEIGLPAFGVVPASKIYFDFVKNLAEDANDAQGGGQDKAWMIGAGLGKAKKKGTWELKYEYVWIEANAVPGVFTDSDFGGTTDRRGSVVKAAYALTDHLTLGFAAFFTNRILTGNPARADEDRRLFQTDLVWKF